MLHSFTSNSHLDSCNKDALLIASLFPSHKHKHVQSCRVKDFDLSCVKDGDVVFISCHTNIEVDMTRKGGVRAEFIFEEEILSEDVIYNFLNTFNGSVTFILDCCKAELFTRVKKCSCSYEFYCSSNKNTYSFDSNLLNQSVFSYIFTLLFKDYSGKELIDAVNKEYRRRRYNTRAIYKSSTMFSSKLIFTSS